MIDNDSEYKALKELCRNEIFQFTQPSGYDIVQFPKTEETLDCPHWVFSEEYALKQKKFELYWHTSWVIDGGITMSATIDENNELHIVTIRDGIICLGVIDAKTIQLEKGRNRMITVNVDAQVKFVESCKYGSGKIHVSFFDDPKYVLWTVKYFDYIANRDAFVTVRARSANEAKVVAWYHSPWHQCQNEEKPIDPMYFDAVPYRPVQVLTRAGEKSTGLNDLSDAVMATQIAICEKYDKEQNDGSAA